MSYGNGISVNLLQLARAYTVFANDGELRPVTLVKQESATAGSKVFSATTAREVRDMLEMVVKPGGTAPLGADCRLSCSRENGTAHKLGGRALRRSLCGLICWNGAGLESTPDRGSDD
jgi:cell division protein FtsI (penicillin-binding protein 3)